MPRRVIARDNHVMKSNGVSGKKSHRRDRMAPCMLAIAFFILGTGPAPGQDSEPFHFDSVPRFYEIETVSSFLYAHNMDLLDFDGDGDLDMARIPGDGMSLEFIRNEGGALRMHSFVHIYNTYNLCPSDVKSGDFNNDGIQDVVVFGFSKFFPYSCEMIVFTGDGAGGFSPQPAQPLPFDYLCFNLSVSDIDGDSLDDIVAWDYVGDQVFIQLGSGSQSQFTAAGLIYEMEVCDLDGDTYPDLVMVLHTQPNLGEVYIYFNDGSGGFPTQPKSLGLLNFPAGLELLDADGDGNTDIVTADLIGSVYNPKVELAAYLGDGSGGFGPPVFSWMHYAQWFVSDIESADCDGDGLVDLVVSYEFTYGDIYGLLTVTKNVGKGKFVAHSSASLYGNDFEILDLTGSGALKILTVEGIVVPVDGAGHIGGGGIESALPMFAFLAQTVGDFDQDGVEDLMTYDFYTRTLKLYLLDGEGGVLWEFHIWQGTPSDTGLPYSGDLDGDGFMDVVLMKPDEIIAFRNKNGSGFGPPIYTNLPPACIWKPRGYALGDLNGDGFVDIVQSNDRYPDGMVALGVGDGTFSASCLTYAGLPGDITLADFTGDLLLDLAYADHNDGSFFVLPGLGNGTFGPPIHSKKIDVGFMQTRGDVDNDGDVDVVANWSSGFRVLKNDGSGKFTHGQTVTIDWHFRDFELLDLDKDGDLDLVAEEKELHRLIWAFQNQGGTFQETQPRWVVGCGTSGIGVTNLDAQVSVGDFDGDGFDDVCVGNMTDHSSAPLPVFLLNRSMLRQEGLAKGGHTVTLELRAPLAANQAYLTLASSTGSYPGLPLGKGLLPLNYDHLLWSLSMSGGGVFVQFSGFLDMEGRAEAEMVLPPGLTIPPLDLDFAFVTFAALPPHGIMTSNGLGVTVR